MAAMKPLPSEPTPSRLVEVVVDAWPVVLLRCPAVLDLPAINSMFQGMERVVERQARFSLVVDTRALARFPDAVGRKTIAHWMAIHTTAEALYNLGNAVVIGSAPARAALTAIQWVRKPVCPHAYVSTTSDAIDWCSERLRAADIPLPSSVRALRAAELLRDARR